MNGLELSEKYYETYGKKIFHTRFKALMPRIAVGLVGPGSECLGFDDEHSQDHDWGPSFCLWVSQEDYKHYGKDLQACYDNLPKSFNGFSPRQESPGEKNRVGVMGIESFYSRYTGLPHPPRTIGEWQRIPEANLAICTNGKVFYDPLGEFTQWRDALLEFYPNELIIKKIANCCMHAGQAGQYNWQRGLLRNDPYSVNVAKNNFCTQIMQLTYLINKKYAPFYKWLYAGFKQLPILTPELLPLMDRLLTSANVFSNTIGNDEWGHQQDLIQQICTLIINQLTTSDMTEQTSPFLIDHVPDILSRTT